ncbi:cation diffusion facilitator family transporter [Paenibacillus algicola]|uniref:Cation diffusion facilitator family transporter n=1 Tax=Paenibacillus algicola TaxID=2565926 RepID=A0A4P8XLE6_9BACL|nr:cation diffusion facilitator family transporter [Paenibacillus algicola]QCT00999.1 cation diffusion facilitator family transporter [Paenibacillus algicola]
MSSHSHSHHGHNHDHTCHGHGHGHHGHHHGHHHGLDPQGNKKGLLLALGITFSIMLLEFFGGLLTNSLALLSDSGHMLSDTVSLLLSLVAVSFASRPSSPKRTFGFYRFEILAALLNGVTLFVVAGFIMWEAYGRFTEPPEVASGSMMLIASIGLAANVLSAWALMRKGDVKNNINLRSAYLHVLGDALGSVGAIAAGAVMLLFGWYIADPIISVVVALLILRGAWGVITHTVHILMEGTPAHVNAADVEDVLSRIPGVTEVHDLHIWSITSGLDSLSCHLVITDGQNSQIVLQAAITTIAERFGIDHTTIQIETPATRHAELKV